MIKIIQNGKIKHERTCKKCECLFSYEAVDVTRVTLWDDHGGHYPVTDVYRIKCPCCGINQDLFDVFTEQEKSQMKHVDH